MGTPGCTAYLRVYEPLESFPADERLRWDRYLAETGGYSGPEASRAEHDAGLAAATLPSLHGPGEHACVLVEGAETYLCPWRSGLRMAGAALAARAGMAGVLADAFVPPRLAEAAAERVRRARDAPSPVRVGVRTANWVVPIAWFVPFAADERHAATAGTPWVVYRTRVRTARSRITGALAVLAVTLPAAAVTVELTELGAWLADFDARGILELDYGGLAERGGVRLAITDTSVADVTGALAALAGGDEALALRRYRRLVERWRPLRDLEVAC